MNREQLLHYINVLNTLAHQVLRMLQERSAAPDWADRMEDYSDQVEDLLNAPLCNGERILVGLGYVARQLEAIQKDCDHCLMN